jgi:hypothetical protein
MKAWLVACLAVGALVSPVAAAENPLGCFVRNYDRAHLASHPHQRVTNVRLLIKPAPRGQPHAYEFSLQMKVRGNNQTLSTEGQCDKRGAGLECMVECDGGGVNVSPRPGHVMMSLERIRMATCGNAEDENAIEIEGGKDDRVFRIDRVNEAACRKPAF